MSSRPDLGPKPRLGYTDSRLERAAELRADKAAIDAMAAGVRAGAYVIGGELIVTRKGAPLNDPLFTLSEARNFGPATETIFLGHLNGEGRFGIGILPETADTAAHRIVDRLRASYSRSAIACAISSVESDPPMS